MVGGKKNANEKKSLSVAATAVFGFCCLTQKQILSRERNKKAKEKVKNGDFFPAIYILSPSLVTELIRFWGMILLLFVFVARKK